jgi:RNA polymerase sigma-70 factor, ECF subfamily
MNKSQKETEFLDLIKKHQNIIHKICFVYSNNKYDRQDLYQEIILQLWKSFSSFKSQSAFSTWMYRVALNTAITVRKKQNIFVYTENPPTGISNNNEHFIDLSEEIKILYNAIGHLKKVEKAIILLWLEEKSYEEIAGTIGISIKNVSVKLVRIKAKLAEIIEKLQ